MNQDEIRRDYVANMYAGPNWKKQVAEMSTDQITAIYLRFIRDDQKPTPKQKIPEDPQFRLF